MILLIAGLLIADAAAYIGLSRHLENRSEHALDRVVAYLDGLDGQDSLDVLTPSVQAAAFPGLAIVVHSPDGVVQASTAPRSASGDPDLDGYLTRTWTPEGEFTLRAPAGRRVVVGEITVGISRAGDRETLRTLLFVELAVGVLVIALGALIGRRLLRRGLLPLRAMAEAADRIVAGGKETLPSGPPGTETYDLAAALDRAISARVRSEEAVRSFLADSSHELRTPVAAIRGWADLHAAGALPEREDIAAAMASIGLESSRMGALVEQMLALARLDAGVDAAREILDLDAIVRASVSSGRAVLGRGAHRLSLGEGTPRDVPAPVGDPDAVRRAVDNLVLNAVEHAGEDALIEVEWGWRRESWFVEVADNGRGLTPSEIGSAFDRFWRGDPSRNRSGGGSGLGLAIARQTARAHGGDLTLRPGREGGLVAVLTLPEGGTSSAVPQQTVSITDHGSSDRRDEVGSVKNTLRSVPGSFVSRRPWWVLGLWFAMTAAATVFAFSSGGGFSNDIALPGSASDRGADLIERHGEPGDIATGVAVVRATDGVRSHRAAIEALVEDWSTLAGVVSVSTPFEPGTVSSDGKTATVTLRLSEPPMKAPRSVTDQIAGAADSATGVDVDFAGSLGSAIERGGRTHLPELVGLVVALVLLLIIFGSVLAAIAPVVAAVLSLGLGLGLLVTLASAVSFGTAAPTLASMIGLGCGIDYALFVLTRARQRLLEGYSAQSAVDSALRSTGHAVAVAAGTVSLALLGLHLSGVEFVARLGLAATIAVATAAVSALTLVPAAVTILGRRIDRIAVRTVVAESAGEQDRWVRHARRVSSHPVVALVGAVALLSLLALPALDLRLGHVDEGADPPGSTTRSAYDALATGFGPGANARMTVVADLAEVRPGQVPAALEEAHHSVMELPGIESLTPFVPSKDGLMATARLTPTGGPESPVTAAIHDEVSGETSRDLRAHNGVRLFLAGPTAAQFDLQERLGSRLPVIIALVLAVSLILVSIAFRSPVVAMKAVVMTAVSITASYGVLVAIFQWQWGSGLLGLDQSVPIESFVPMMLFVIVFGLSMDYEVFLIAAVRDAWRSGATTTEAVAKGLAGTARVITAAALTMISVFVAFAFTDDVGVVMMAVGLAASVVIDVTVVRLLLVPAAMVLLGSANWWCPAWLRGQRRRDEPGAQPQMVGVGSPFA